jgi:hypothetical protein
MPFPQLQLYKDQYPEWAGRFVELERFLDEVLHRPPRNPKEFWSAATHDINPLWVSKRLQISKADAIALLYLCEKAGVVNPRFDVYCPEKETFIASFSSSAELPLKIECDNHEWEIEHSIEEYYVNLIFEFTPQIVEGEFILAAVG